MTVQSEAALEAYKPYEQFCRVMLDAYFVVDCDGKIVKSNPGAVALTGVTAKQQLKVDSLDTILTITESGVSFSIKDLLKNIGPVRKDHLKATNVSGTDLVLTISYFPFITAGKLVGAFLLARDVTAEEIYSDKFKVATSKSITDPLTGLYNRAHFEDYLKTEEPRIVTLPASSDHRNMSIIMGDIDHFKKINDKFGHPAGDYVIKTVAEVFQKTFRRTDVICRYGGEEFLVILPASESKGSLVAAEKVRAAVEGFKFEFDGAVIPVTMSFGVAQMMVGQESGKDTIARADAALYRSKQSGRNQVSFHTGAAIVGPAIVSAA